MKWVDNLKRLKKELYEIQSRLKFDSIKNGKSLQVSLNEKSIVIVKWHAPDDTNAETITLDYNELDEISNFVSHCVNEEED